MVHNPTLLQDATRRRRRAKMAAEVARPAVTDPMPKLPSLLHLRPDCTAGAWQVQDILLPRLTPAARHDAGDGRQSACVWRVGRAVLSCPGCLGLCAEPPVGPSEQGGRRSGWRPWRARAGSIQAAAKVDLLDATANAVGACGPHRRPDQGVETALPAPSADSCCSRRRRVQGTGGHGWRYVDARRA